ncbi:response regulator [Parvularcula sp. LCG005]|uniref:response regulator n=1 Tax=Parvularcula sp. LCG005 TaxID=3078805 RepID=UPI0029423A01|nr:response regulator [Parvularcula sp. LCG005]WOI54447.1 response regulator [Parvularcula sp. LCG005]
MTTCLVIEDSDVVREVMCKILRGLGIDVLEADGLATAVPVAENDRPDLIFLDWDLPHFGALDFLRSTFVSLRERRTPMVLCATEYDPRQIALAKAAGVEYHLLKPFDPAAIRALLRRMQIVVDVPANLIDPSEDESGHFVQKMGQR